jgi:hypothetical protein
MLASVNASSHLLIYIKPSSIKVKHENVNNKHHHHNKERGMTEKPHTNENRKKEDSSSPEL